MTGKNKILKILIYITGIICLLIYIYVRLKDKPFNLIDKEYLYEEKRGIYGDLYNLNLIDRFKIPLPEIYPSFRTSPNNSRPENAEIIIFGDSFFDVGSHNKQIPERIYDTLKRNVSFLSTYQCIAELNKLGYKKSNRKKLVYEIVERNIFEIFGSKQRTYYKKTSEFENIKNILFPIDREQRYFYLLQRNILLKSLYIGYVNFKFDYLGIISSSTPVYSVNPPWLFHFIEVNGKNTSFYYDFTKEELDNVINNIYDFNTRLDSLYNLKLIFIPIPNKYTIYHKILNNDTYNNLLPDLYTGLKSKGIRFIELYNDFITSKEVLYYPTDTHYNIEGENIVYQKLLKSLSENN